MRNYKPLNIQEFESGEFKLIPIRNEDRYLIMKWRNEQMYHLRQNKKLSYKDQDDYFENVVSTLFSKDQPEQILFSFLKDGELIGYGGLVHMNWVDKNAEISFVMNTELESDHFEEYWIIYLGLIEKIAFQQLSLHKIFTYAFDLRPQLYNVLLMSGYSETIRLKEHCFIDNKFIDVVISTKFNHVKNSFENHIKQDNVEITNKILYGNVLVTSASKKIGLLKAIKKAANKISNEIKIFAGDTNPNTLCKYFADDFYLMPRTIESSKSDILNWCKKNNITAIVPTRDGELLFWANLKLDLLNNGIRVMVPDSQSVEMCLDKLLFSSYCRNLNLPAINSELRVDNCDSNYYVVKERYGAGSLSIAINVNKAAAVIHSETLENPIFQPFIHGTEISVDSYITQSGIVKGIVTRFRSLVDNGESVITETFFNESLSKELSEILTKLNLYGHVILQIILDTNNKIHIIECNSRFGGASTLSIEAGLDSFYWFLHEANCINIDNMPFQLKKQKITQIRFPQDLIVYDTSI